MLSRINLFEKFCSERNIRDGTIKSYVSTIQKFEDFIGKDIETIINEAILEEEQRIPLKDRQLKNDLLEYRHFLLSSDMSPNTVRTYFSKIKTFLKHFEVEIPVLPEAKYEKDYETSYLDLPTKEHISKAMAVSSVDLRAIILFMASSGTAKAETLSLTVGDFIRATSEYHRGGSIEDVLQTLSRRHDVVPTFYLKRIKTDKFYYTFCSSEASEHIVEYLSLRKNLSYDDKLFDISDSKLVSKFQGLNDKLEWGFKGRYRFFRSHTLRKFHASNIGLPAEQVDALQGRSKNSIHETYIKTNPKKLKETYKKVVHNVTIVADEDRHQTINEEFHITINVFLSDKECHLI